MRKHIPDATVARLDGFRKSGFVFGPVLWLVHDTSDDLFWEVEHLAMARRHLDTALTLHPRYAKAHLLRGTLLLRTGRPEAAPGHHDDAQQRCRYPPPPTGHGVPPSPVGAPCSVPTSTPA